MAAMVLSQHHHPTMWDPSRSSEHTIPSSLQMPSMLSSSDHGSMSNRSFEHNAMHLSQMPVYQSNTFAGSLPYQSNGYAFDMPQASHYTINQPAFHFQTPSAATSSTYASGTVEVLPSNPSSHDTHNHIPTTSRTPSVKAETPSPSNQSPNVHIRSKSNSEARVLESEERASPHFSTEIDCLMRTIQAQQSQPPKSSTQASRLPRRTDSLHLSTNTETLQTVNTKTRKQYLCTEPGCDKIFYQKTHLDIHIRSHSGLKPFICHAANCGARFSQLGNLKTHERRHTGERPFRCDICGKTFAQRGNVRAHRIVHENKKPFICKLDDCGKQFTQLGNLKSHQNKFHADTVRYLTQKFTTLRSGEEVSAHDRAMWEYFADLYKNSNKGIKGRGKDRRIATVPSPHASTTFVPITTQGPSTPGPAMSRTATEISSHAQSVERTSRASSHTAVPQYTHMDLHHHHHHHQPVRPLAHDIHQNYAQDYSEPQYYNNEIYQRRYA